MQGFAQPSIPAALVELLICRRFGFGESRRRGADEPGKEVVVLPTMRGAIVADEPGASGQAATVRGDHGGDGVLDVDQIEPGLGISRKGRAVSELLNASDQSSRAVDSGKAEYLGTRSFAPQ